MAEAEVAELTRMELAEAARAELRRLERAGKLDAQDVREAARHPDSPLHSYFNWDDEAAAEAFRLAQAHALIRRYKMVVTVEEREVVVARYVKADDEPEVYSVLPRVRKSGAAELARSELARVIGGLERLVAIAEARRDVMPASLGETAQKCVGILTAELKSLME